MNQCYNKLRDTLENAEQKVTEFQEELADQEGRLQEIPTLKSALLKPNAARHADQEKNRRQMRRYRRS